MKSGRLSILIPLLLILSSVTSSALLFWQEIRVANNSIQQAGTDNLHTTLTQLQNMLNTQLAADSLEDAKLSLAVSALHPGIRTLLLADQNDTVMLANRYIWEGSRATQVSGYSDMIAQQVRQTQASSVSPDASLLRGYYPVTLKIVAGGLGVNRVGVLFVEYDLAPQLALARHNAVVQAASFGGLMIAVAIAVALLLYWLVTRRVEKMVEVSKYFAAGDLDARVHLHGHDELSELGHAFDDMASQRKAAQGALLQAGNYNRSLIEASLDPLVTISTEGKITDVNQATEAVTGRNRAELIGTDFSDYFTAPDKARKGYQLVFLNGSVTDYPLALRHRDGHVTEVLYNASVYRDETGAVLGVFAAARDITEHKRAEATRTQLAAIVESSNDAIIGKTTDGIITSWNKSATRIYGYSADEIIGKSINTLAPPSRHAEIRELLGRVRKGGVVANHESERIRKDGVLIQVALTLSPIRDASGNISGISTIARDITERKKAEFVLRQSEEALKEAQRIARVGSWHMDLATNQVVWSEVLYEMYGFDPALPPPLYTESMKLFTPESWERLSTSIAKCTETGIPYELELEMVPKEGGRKWMLARGELVRDASGAAVRVRGVVMDITGRKQAEGELQERERHSQSLLRLSRNMEASQTYGDVLIAAQDEVKKIMGYQSLWVYLFTEDKQYLKALIASGPISDTVMSEQGTATLTIKGDRMLEEIAASKEIVLVEDARTDGRVNKEIAARLGMRTIVNIPIMMFDRHLGCVGTGTFGAEGVRVPTSSEQKYLVAMASHMAVALDRIHLLAERRQANDKINELNRNLEHRVDERTAQLEAANKELESFSYSVSHDLRTPLRAIDGFSHILLEDYAGKLDDEGKRLLNVVRDNAGKMGKLIDDILKFSRAGRLEITFSEMDMEGLAREVYEELRPFAGHELQVEIGHIPPAIGDRVMMRQVLVNLLSNAIKFTGSRVGARIEVGSSDGETETVYFVKDNGVGFDMQYAGKLFGVFQRLHGPEEFEGTGIGLAIVKRIITRHGGRVWAEGKLNEGATIYFSIPVPVLV